MKTTKFDWKVVATHLCQSKKARDVPEIQLYGAGAVEAWTLSKPKSVGVEFSISGQFNPHKPSEEQVVRSLFSEARSLYKSLQPDEPFVNPATQKPMESDLEQVSIFQVSCKAYRSTMPIPVAVRMNWQHSSQAQLEGTAVVDSIFAAADAIKGAFLSLEPTEGGREEALKSFPLPELQHGYQNSRFAATFAYLNETNLLNGLVEIPSNVCKQAGLPIWSGPPTAPEDLVLQQLRALKIEDPNSAEAATAKKDVQQQYEEQFAEQYTSENSKPITHYVALPYNHVLAWGYASDEYYTQRNHRIYRFTYKSTDTGEPVLLYYLVPNVLMDFLIEEAKEVWLSKVDKRPLASVGMEFLPDPSPKYANAPVAPGLVSLRCYYSYVSGPRLKQGTIDALAPTMCPDFPPCQNWSMEEQARKAAFEEHERQNQ